MPRSALEPGLNGFKRIKETRSPNARRNSALPRTSKVAESAFLHRNGPLSLATREALTAVGDVPHSLAS